MKNASDRIYFPIDSLNIAEQSIQVYFNKEIMLGKRMRFYPNMTEKPFLRSDRFLKVSRSSWLQAPTIEWQRSKTIRSLIQIFFVEGHTVLRGGRFRNELAKMKTSFSENKPYQYYRQKNLSKP